VSPYRAEPSAGNGAEFETYSWSQTLGDVSLTVPLPRGVKGRDCDVSIMKDKLRVRRHTIGCTPMCCDAANAAPTGYLPPLSCRFWCSFLAKYLLHCRMTVIAGELWSL